MGGLPRYEDRRLFFALCLYDTLAGYLHPESLQTEVKTAENKGFVGSKSGTRAALIFHGQHRSPVLTRARERNVQS